MFLYCYCRCYRRHNISWQLLIIITIVFRAIVTTATVTAIIITNVFRQVMKAHCFDAYHVRFVI